jgi:hypothetical protein
LPLHVDYEFINNFCSWTDETFLIVNVGDEGIVTVVAHQSSREVIPCKPTSPKVELTLFDPNGLEVTIQFSNIYQICRRKRRGLFSSALFNNHWLKVGLDALVHLVVVVVMACIIHRIVLGLFACLVIHVYT